MKTCRLQIFVKGKPILQGKFYYLGNKPIFLANVDEQKLWGKTGTLPTGFSIANQLLEAFSKAKVRPLILYHFTTKNLVYKATPSTFKKYGFMVDYGSHRQTLLPLTKWTFFKEALCEPYGLPKLSVDDWLRANQKVIEDYSAPLSVMMKLKEEAKKQGWYSPKSDSSADLGL